MANFKVDDYASNKAVNADLVRSGSPLHEFPFTDSLTYDQQYETDSQPVLTAGLFRTSRGPDRVQLSSFNPVTGAQRGGLYIFVDGIVTTSISDGTIFFYNAGGSVDGYIQDQNGTLYIFGDEVEIQSLSDIIFTPAPANAVIVDGTLSVTGVIAGEEIVAGSHLGVVDAISAPATIPGIAQIYVDSADNDLKVKFGNGNVAVLAAN